MAVGDYLPADALTDVDSLIDHGEPAEGVCALAWALHNAQVEVPAWVNEAIRDLTYGLVVPDHMPPLTPEVPGHVRNCVPDRVCSARLVVVQPDERVPGSPKVRGRPRSASHQSGAEEGGGLSPDFPKHTFPRRSS